MQNVTLSSVEQSHFLSDLAPASFAGGGFLFLLSLVRSAGSEPKRPHPRGVSRGIPQSVTFIGIFDGVGKKLFLTLSEIETHKDFRLNSESELIATPKKKRKHIRLLKRYDEIRGRCNRDAKAINDYKQVADVVQKKMGKQLSVATGDDAELLEIDDISILHKNKFHKKVQTLPALPADGESNGDWITLSSFVKSNNIPQKTVEAIFSRRRKSITIDHNGCKYGKSEAKAWEGLIWCQKPEKMKSISNDTGYFIFRDSLLGPITARIEKKYKNQ